MEIARIERFRRDEQSVELHVVVVGVESDESLAERSIEPEAQFLTFDKAQVFVATTLRVGSLHGVGALAPSPPSTGGGEDVVVHIVLLNIEILVDHTVGGVDLQVVEPRLRRLHPFLTADAPGDGPHRREGLAVSLSEFCRVDGCHSQVGVVAAVVVVVDVQAEVGVACAVIFSRCGHLIAVCQQGSVEGMEAELTVVVELSGEEDGLNSLGTAHDLCTGALVGAVFVQSDDLVLAVHVCPDGLIGRVVVLNAAAIRGSIVDGGMCLEAQSLQHLVEIEVDTGVELQLTAGIGAVSGCIHGSEGIGLLALCTAEHVLSVNDVVAVGDHLLHIQHVRIHHIDGDQRREGILACGAHRSTLVPVVAAVAALVIEGGIGVDPTGDPVIESQVDVTTHVETVGMVVLTLAELDEVTDMIQSDVGIEVCELAAALKLSVAVVACVGFLEVVF